jgi:hypothetical protein
MSSMSLDDSDAVKNIKSQPTATTNVMIDRAKRIELVWPITNVKLVYDLTLDTTRRRFESIPYFRPLIQDFDADDGTIRINGCDVDVSLEAWHYVWLYTESSVCDPTFHDIGRRHASIVRRTNLTTFIRDRPDSFTSTMVWTLFQRIYVDQLPIQSTRIHVVLDTLLAAMYFQMDELIHVLSVFVVVRCMTSSSSVWNSAFEPVIKGWIQRTTADTRITVVFPPSSIIPFIEQRIISSCKNEKEWRIAFPNNACILDWIASHPQQPTLHDIEKFCQFFVHDDNPQQHVNKQYNRSLFCWVPPSLITRTFDMNAVASHTLFARFLADSLMSGYNSFAIGCQWRDEIKQRFPKWFSSTTTIWVETVRHLVHRHFQRAEEDNKNKDDDDVDDTNPATYMSHLQHLRFQSAFHHRRRDYVDELGIFFAIFAPEWTSIDIPRAIIQSLYNDSFPHPLVMEWECVTVFQFVRAYFPTVDIVWSTPVSAVFAYKYTHWILFQMLVEDARDAARDASRPPIVIHPLAIISQVMNESRGRFIDKHDDELHDYETTKIDRLHWIVRNTPFESVVIPFLRYLVSIDVHVDHTAACIDERMVLIAYLVTCPEFQAWVGDDESRRVSITSAITIFIDSEHSILWSSKDDDVVRQLLQYVLGDHRGTNHSRRHVDELFAYIGECDATGVSWLSFIDMDNKSSIVSEMHEIRQRNHMNLWLAYATRYEQTRDDHDSLSLPISAIENRKWFDLTNTASRFDEYAVAMTNLVGQLPPASTFDDHWLLVDQHPLLTASHRLSDWAKYICSPMLVHPMVKVRKASRDIPRRSWPPPPLHASSSACAIVS